MDTQDPLQLGLSWYAEPRWVEYPGSQPEHLPIPVMLRSDRNQVLANGDEEFSWKVDLPFLAWRIGLKNYLMR